MIHYFAIPDRPIPKGRPRFKALAGGKVVTFTPKATQEAELYVARCYQGGPLFDGPIGMRMEFCPRNTIVAIWPVAEASPLKGDIDNYAKLILDGLEGVAYLNDRQVMSMSATKLA